MKTKSIDINALAIESRDGLATGAQDKFTQLYEELNGRKQAYITSSIAKYPSLNADDLDALFDDLLLAELRKYDASKPDFLQCLNQALHFRTLSILPRAIARRKLTESLESTVEERGDASLPPVYDTETEFSDEVSSFLDEAAEEEWLNMMLDRFGIEGAAARTAAILRYRHGLSYEEVPNLLPHFFRNKQQAHRAVFGQAKKD